MNARDPIPFAAGVLTASLYVATAAPGVFFADSGELIAAAVSYGLPHSPSFPLYVTFARVLAWASGPGVGLALNLFSAAAAGLAIGLLCRVLTRLVLDGGGSLTSARVGAALGALALAADKALWSQSVRAEVYSLNILAIVLLLHLIQPLASGSGPLSTSERRRFALAGLVGGLGLAVHSLLMGTTGVVFLVYVAARRREVLFPRSLLPPVLAGLSGLTAYVVLPLRSIHYPALDYGHPANWANFVEAVTRKSTGLAGSVARNDVVERALTFLSAVPDGFGALLAVFAVVCAGFAAWRYRGMFALGLGLFVAGFLVSTRGTHFRLTNPDAWGYLTMAHLGVAIILAAGVSGVIRSLARVLWSRGRRALVVVATVLLLVLIGGAMWRTGFSESLHGFDNPERLAAKVASETPYNAMVVSDNAATFFLLFHSTITHRKRPDLSVVAGSVVLQKAYRDGLDRNPRIATVPIETLIPKTTDGYESISGADARRLYLHALVDSNITRRPVLWGQSSGVPFPETRLSLNGFFATVSPPGDTAVFLPESLEVNIVRTVVSCTDALPTVQPDLRVYLKAHCNNAAFFCLRRGRPVSAERLSLLALHVAPDDARSLAGLAEAMIAQDRTDEARAVLSAAFELYPDHAALLRVAMLERLVSGDTASALIIYDELASLQVDLVMPLRAVPVDADPFFVVVVFVFGLVIGSFLNVVIWRVPRGESVVSPPSHCPSCNAPIELYDNVPLLSFVLLRGRCRHCRARISWRYPFIEFLTGAIFALLYVTFGWSVAFVGFVPFAAALIAIFFIDLEHFVIPDRLDLPFIVLGIAFAFVDPSRSVVSSLIGVLVGGGGFLAVAILGDRLFGRESMGGGDIKLMAAVGAYLGWAGAIIVTVIGAFLGTIIGVTAMLVSKRVREDHVVPFGPFLVVATFVAIFFGNDLIRMYLRLFPVLAH